jgi:hypothetical protein
VLGLCVGATSSEYFAPTWRLFSSSGWSMAHGEPLLPWQGGSATPYGPRWSIRAPRAASMINHAPMISYPLMPRVARDAPSTTGDQVDPSVGPASPALVDGNDPVRPFSRHQVEIWLAGE